jgi:hypothetical protein
MEFPKRCVLLTRNESSAYLTAKGHKISAATLAAYASKGGGPVITYCGRKPLYAVQDLDAWMAEREIRARSTSDLRLKRTQRERAKLNPGDQSEASSEPQV